MKAMQCRDSLLANMNRSQAKFEECENTLVSSSTSSLTLLTNAAFKPQFHIIEITCNYNKLQKYLSKFQDKFKYRSNIIRWQVLPWLKENTVKLSVLIGDMNSHLEKKNSTRWKLTSKEKKLHQGRLVLLRWWRDLLNSLTTIDSEERSLYYECILIIMSRSEFMDYDYSQWTHKTSNKTILGYRQLLRSTLINVISKLNQSALLTNILDFCAKILAVCFFKVPGLAPILLFNLPVRPIVFQRLHSELKSYASLFPAQEEVALRSIFPSFLNPIMSTHFHLYHQYITMFQHDLDLPASLKVKSSSWIKRWRGDDSDLFFSFYQHYHHMLKQSISLVQGPSKHRRLHQRNAVLSVLPGYIYFASFIAQKIESLIHRKIYTVTNNVGPRPGLAHGTFMDMYRNLQDTTGDQNISHEAFCSLMQHLDPQIAFAQISRKPPALENATKRYTSCIVECGLTLSNQTAIFYDMINIWIRLAIKRTALNEVEQVYCLFDFIEQLLFYMKRRSSQSKEKTWLMDVPYILHTLEIVLAKSDHSLSISRALAFIYTHFDFLTSNLHWLDFLCLRILLTPAIFERLSLHWARHVRLCYLKCLVWRVGRVESTLHIRWYDGFSLIDPLCNHSVCRRKWIRLTDTHINQQNELCSLRIHIELESLLNSFHACYQQTEKSIIHKDIYMTRSTQQPFTPRFISDIRLVHRSTLAAWDEKQRCLSHAPCQAIQSNMLSTCCYKSQRTSTTTRCVLPMLFKTRQYQKEEMDPLNPQVAQEMYALPTTVTSAFCCHSYPTCTHIQTFTSHSYPHAKHVYASKMITELKIVADSFSAWYKNPTILKRNLPELILEWPKNWNLDQVA